MQKSSYRFTGREIATYKKEKALAESKRVDITNAVLISSRRKNLAMFSRNPEFEKTLEKLNDVVKSKPITNTIRVINFWLEGNKFNAS
jgi:hypothetical protein